MTFKTVEAVLSATVAASGTLTLPYPSGSGGQASFDPAGAHLATISGAQLTSAGSDFSLTFGGSDVTFTNGASNFTLPAGATLRVQMVEFTVDIIGADVGFTNIDVGASGQAGTLDIFPATASKGKLRFSAADNVNNQTTTIKNAAQSGTRTYTVPDAGANANFLMSLGAQLVGGVKTFSSSPLTNVNTGSVPATVTAVEFGDGYNHVTVLTVTAAVLVPDIPADAEEVGALVYTFPAGVHQVHSVHMDITAIVEGANSNAVDIGCGSTLAAGDGATLQAATDEDFLDGQTIANSSSPAIEKSLAADGTVFESGDSKLFHINLAGTWTATEADPSITGTVTIRWSYLGA